MHQDFKQRLSSGSPLVGTMVTIAAPEVSEILLDVGFDWLFIDGEHGPLGLHEIKGILQTVGNHIPCLVRTPDDSQVAIKQVLDLGAAGIIVPQVNTAVEAAAVVQHAKYAPMGQRGVGLARAHGYGGSFQDYLQRANDETCVVVQAEHRDAVDNIEEIINVDGIDAILLGPYDLSASLNRMGQIDSPEVTEAIARVTDACISKSMPLGYFGVSADAVKPFADRGYSLLVAGVDTLFLRGAAAKTLNALRE